jgi:2-succinyl-5-enolpyruvyl-6-hydroxy-3-cyclohexene-1-carboxylate synthase
MKIDAPNLNALWCALLMEELERQHVNYVGVAPGSRSSPLALAAAAHPRIKLVVHFDERALAFHVLGWARATGRPAAIITTSGTAVSNLAPAVAEASLDHVPLIVLTADRPPELRDTAANQTMDQVKLFGAQVRWQFDLPCPSADIPLRMLLTTVDQAVARARWGQAGPVHLNCMFREPLAPVAVAYPKARLLAPLRGWLKTGKPLTDYLSASGPAPSPPVAIPEALRGVRKGVLVAGALKPDEAEAAIRLARHLQWPLLPDLQSGLRLGRHASVVVPYADLILGSSTWLKNHQPEAVLLVGGRLISKRLSALAQSAEGLPVVRITDSLERQDPGHRVDVQWVGPVAHTLESLQAALPAATGDASWLEPWQHAGRQVGLDLLRRMKQSRRLHEPRLAWELTRLLPAEHALFAGNSLPVRLLDTFAAADHAWVTVGANRGVSGIDGLLSTATGFAAGRGKPVTLLMGDLSLLHDLNGLALLQRAAVPVIAVVINNDGGGIFSFLPVAEGVPNFEKVFGLPHGRTFAGAASMFDLPYTRVRTTNAFIRAYRAACQRNRSALIEVTTDRRTALSIWRSLQNGQAQLLNGR